MNLTVDKDGWVQQFPNIPGPKDKVYSQKNSGDFIVNHSIVGSVQSALSRFMSTARNADGNYTGNAAASVMFLNPLSGLPIQMYPIWASTWTTGGPEANTAMWAVENEGGGYPNYSEPLNPNQVTNLFLIKQLWEQTKKKVATRGTFREHGEVARSYGYAPTACPSGRIQPFYDELEREPDLTKDEVAEIVNNIIDEKLRNSQLIDSGQIPELVAQIVGVIENGYTSKEDLELITAIRAKLIPARTAQLNPSPTTPGKQVSGG